MSDFHDPRDEGAVGGEDIHMKTFDNDYDYDDNEDGSGLDIQSYAGPSIKEEIQMVNLSQKDRFKKSYFESLFENYKNVGITTNKVDDPNDFEYVDVGKGKKELRLKEFPYESLFNKKNGMPLAISTLYQRVKKEGLEILGFENYYKGAKTKDELLPKQERIVQKSLEKIEEAEKTFTENPI